MYRVLCLIVSLSSARLSNHPVPHSSLCIVGIIIAEILHIGVNDTSLHKPESLVQAQTVWRALETHVDASCISLLDSPSEQARASSSALELGINTEDVKHYMKESVSRIRRSACAGNQGDIQI